MQNAEPESKVSDDDWPSFLYPEDNYDLGAIDKGLLRGPFLLSVSLHSDIRYMLNFSIVFPASVYGSAHRSEGNPGKGAWQEMSGGPLQHDQGDTPTHRICGGHREFPPT